MTLHSECDNATDFDYPTLPGAGCHNYSFVVTPINVVGSGEENVYVFAGAMISMFNLNFVNITLHGTSNFDCDRGIGRIFQGGGGGVQFMQTTPI